MTDFFILLLGAITAGLLGALTGLGGGVIIVPLLTVGYGIPIHYAVGASLICIIGTSTGTAATYVKEGFTNIRIGILLEVSTTLGAIAGATLAGILPGSILTVIFGVILLITVVLNKLNKPNHQTELIAGSWAEKLKLYGNYYENQKKVPYAASNVIGGFTIMGIAGALSGLLGIGGGAFKVLAMDNVMKLPFKVSTTTSNFMIGVTAATSALIYFQRGYIIPELAAPILLGVVIGSFIGTKIFIKAKTQTLKTIFTVVVSVISFYMIYKGLTNNIN